MREKKRKYAVKHDQGLRQQKHLSRAHARARLEKGCCSKNCINAFTVEEILEARMPYWSESVEGRDSHLRSILGQREKGVINDGGKGYTIMDKKLCSQGLVNVLGISKDALYRQVHVVVHNRPEAGFRSHSWKNRVYFGNKRAEAVGWLAGYTSMRSSVGDWQPDKKELHLAHSQKKQIYRLYVKELEILGLTPCERSYFGRVFSEHFPHVRVHKWKNFTKCSRCSFLDNQLAKAQDRVTIKSNRDLIWQHLNVVFDQKQKHWKHVYKAKRHPTKYMVTSHDGMDSYKTTIPRYPRCPKELQIIAVLKTHVCGVLTHAHAPYAYAYVSPPGVGTGACLSVEFLMRTLIKMKRTNGYIPPVW